MREFVWLPILKGLISGHNDIRIVVHASARRHSNPGFLGTRMDLPDNVYLGVTPGHLDRWPSILAWLGERPEVVSFRILDDQGIEFPATPPAELILCKPNLGVSEARVQNALKEWLLSG